VAPEGQPADVFPLYIAHVLFWALLLIGAAEIGAAEIGRRACSVYAALWLLGYFGSSWLQSGGWLFLSYVALLDVALVFHVFKGDVQLR
jgi:hypothetical protein